MTARIGLVLVVVAMPPWFGAHGNLVAQNAPARSIVVLSDLHMGVGRQPSGEWDPTEDFRWSAEFGRFLDAVNRDGRQAVDLVLNGDTFELTDCAGISADAGCSEATALTRLETVLKAHDADVKALGQFARTGSNRVVLVPGDQDAALLFPAVARRAATAIGPDASRVQVMASGYWLSQDGDVYAEHGHQIGLRGDSFERWPSPFVGRSGAQRLLRPWAEALTEDLYREYEVRIPVIDNVAALGTGLKYIASTDDRRIEDAGPRMLRYLLFTISWQQFRMELDDGDVQPPTWDLAQVRAQGRSFVTASFPDDDPAKPLAAKLVANGRLDAIELSDDEIVMLCDYRAAVRRSRRRLEPTLTQLAPRGPAVVECPRMPDTRGAAFEYFWRSRDQIAQRRLAAVTAAIPKRSKPLSVFVYGHTHLPDRGQSGANLISGGVLKIPMEGFSPVRGQLTPVVINDGAWQRTITPVQLDRRASEKNVSVADLVATMKPEDLAPCYSFVRIATENGAPAPAVRYWRQTAGGEWGIAAGCAGQ